MAGLKELMYGCHSSASNTLGSGFSQGQGRSTKCGEGMRIASTPSPWKHMVDGNRVKVDKGMVPTYGAMALCASILVAGRGVASPKL